MTKDYEIEFIIDGVNRGSGFIQVIDGKLYTEGAEEAFYKVLRHNEKDLLEDAETEERDEIVNNLTTEQEDKLKEAHAKDYHGTDDDMPDAFDDFLGEISLAELKEILK